MSVYICHDLKFKFIFTKSWFRKEFHKKMAAHIGWCLPVAQKIAVECELRSQRLKPLGRTTTYLHHLTSKLHVFSIWWYFVRKFQFIIERLNLVLNNVFLWILQHFHPCVENSNSTRRPSRYSSANELHTLQRTHRIHLTTSTAAATTDNNNNNNNNLSTTGSVRSWKQSLGRWSWSGDLKILLSYQGTDWNKTF